MLIKKEFTVAKSLDLRNLIKNEVDMAEAYIKAFRAGGVWKSKERITHLDYPLVAGDVLSIWTHPKQDERYSLSKDQIIFEDETDAYLARMQMQY